MGGGGGGLFICFQALLRGRGGGLKRGGGSLNLVKRITGRIEFLPTGARFLEGGLVVPGCSTAFSNNKQMVTILHRVLELKVEKKLST